MEGADARASLDVSVGHTSTVVYSADLGAGRRTRFISDNVAWVLGHAPEMFTGQPGYGTSQLHPEDRPAYFAAVGRLYEVGQLTLAYRLRRQDASWAWIRATLRLVGGGGQGGGEAGRALPRAGGRR